MKKLVLLAILKLLSPAWEHAQNSVPEKLLVPQTSKVRIPRKDEPRHDPYFINSLAIAEHEEKNIFSFLNNEPLLKLSLFPKRSLLFFTEITFTDLLENSINRIKPTLLNTYDDHIDELFREAPSLFKLKCTIAF
ncbi:MAG: hypothetical protein IPJ02_01470 [Chitinophagaceae bacterium]|nr:hypothetical protein [Chitinophagaceae bacterium]